MPKKSTPGALEITLAFRVTAEAYKSIEGAMKQERRIESDVCRCLLERGLAAYKRDGRLFEPPENSRFENPRESRRAAGHGNKT